MIDENTPIEDLVLQLPDAVRYLMNHGIRCLVCGERGWGTLESSAREKGFGEADIRRFVDDLNAMSHESHP